MSDAGATLAKGRVREKLASEVLASFAFFLAWGLKWRPVGVHLGRFSPFLIWVQLGWLEMGSSHSNS